MARVKLVSGSPRWGIEESAHIEHLVLAWIKGEQDPCTGAPTRTSEKWRLSDTSAKHRRVPLALLLYFLAFTLSIYIPRIAMLE